MTYTRPNAAPIKVICLGPSGTGSSSLRDALEIMGFGPCYQYSTILQSDSKNLATWSKIENGDGRPEDFDSLFGGHSSITDYPAAMRVEELYSAYPDAKFILTTRDPEKRENSTKSTIQWAYQALRYLGDKTKLQAAIANWSNVCCEENYHHERIHTRAQQKFLDQTERIKQIIPSEKLLVYNVAEGWDRLVQFLNPPKTHVSRVPCVKDTTRYQTAVSHEINYLTERSVAERKVTKRVAERRVTEREDRRKMLESTCWGFYI